MDQSEMIRAVGKLLRAAVAVEYNMSVASGHQSAIQYGVSVMEEPVFVLKVPGRSGAAVPVVTGCDEFKDQIRAYYQKAALAMNGHIGTNLDVDGYHTVIRKLTPLWGAPVGVRPAFEGARYWRAQDQGSLHIILDKAPFRSGYFTITGFATPVHFQRSLSRAVG